MALDCACGPPPLLRYTLLPDWWRRGGCIVPIGTRTRTRARKALLVERDSMTARVSFRKQPYCGGGSSSSSSSSGSSSSRAAAPVTTEQQQQSSSSNPKMEDVVGAGTVACWCWCWRCLFLLLTLMLPLAVLLLAIVGWQWWHRGQLCRRHRCCCPCYSHAVFCISFFFCLPRCPPSPLTFLLIAGGVACRIRFTSLANTPKSGWEGKTG